MSQETALFVILCDADIALAERRVTELEATEPFGVPRVLAYIAPGPLVVLLGETDGNQEQGRDSLAAVCSSLEHWIDWLGTSSTP